MEAAGLGLFMISACTFGVLLEHPMSPVQNMIEDPIARRALMGIAMGLTSIGIVYSPWGQRSGAHLNPALTLNFLLLGKIAPWDAFFYVVSQFAGGALGVAVADLLLGFPLRHSAVNYVITAPGVWGAGAAFWAELFIAAILMTAILTVSNTRGLSRYTGLLAGGLVATYITFEAPVSGMSLNPARTVGSALSAGEYPGLWIYFTAPILGMFLAARLYLLWRGPRAVYCAKLRHNNHQRCIFRCRFAELEEGE